MIQPGIYQHFKGNRYRVFLCARHSETTEQMVVYQALYGEKGYWVRPAQMFLETVSHNGETVPRFSYIGAANENID